MKGAWLVAATALVAWPGTPLADCSVPGGSVPSSQSAPEPQDMRATDLIGARLLDVRGEVLGRVEDVILAKSGATHYAVLSFERSLGLDNKLYTWPLSGLDAGEKPGEVRVQAQRSAIIKQAGRKLFSLALRMYDPNSVVPEPRYVRASAGKIEDLVFNLASGEARCVTSRRGAR